MKTNQLPQMKSSLELFELIEAYLAGTLKGDDLKAFKKELKTNKALQKEVKLHKEMADLLNEDSDEAAFKNNLKRIDKEHQSKKKGFFGRLFN